MRDVMLDLETLGNGPGCAIVAIGAVPFAYHDGAAQIIGNGFYQVINVASSMCFGLRADASTLQWWGEQAPEARAVIDAAMDATMSQPVLAALALFDRWLEEVSGKSARDSDVRIWGNGADFDNAILAHVYRVAGLEPPWKFFNNRCYRTLKNTGPKLPLLRVGTHHNALDDARTQALHAVNILRALHRLQNPPEEPAPESLH